MRKRLLIAIIVLLCPLGLSAQEAGLSLQDTVVTKKKFLLNDYSMIGISYGITFSTTYFTPPKKNKTFITKPNYISITYTKYCKMFGYMPYFALVTGLDMGTEGFSFRPDTETGKIADADDVQTCSIRLFDIPALAQFHFDFHPGKVFLDLGVFAGWRQSITRSGPWLDPQWEHSFRSYENRFDYGLQGGLGFALMFDPIEINFKCHLRWSWQSIYDPDYSSPYSYKYAYPIDIIASVGVAFQLGRRTGKTKRELKREAYNQVYGTPEDNTSQGR